MQARHRITRAVTPKGLPNNKRLLSGDAGIVELDKIPVVNGVDTSAVKVELDLVKRSLEVVMLLPVKLVVLRRIFCRR